MKNIQKMLSFNKKQQPYELVIGVVLFLLIVMSMNKSLPLDVKDVFLSTPGMLVLFVMVFILFTKKNKVLGVLGVILIYILLQGSSMTTAINHGNGAVLNQVRIPDIKKAYQAPNMVPPEKKASGSLEEEMVQTMLPIAGDININQPKYSAKMSSEEVYTSV
tara:strand:+ start:2941 stop:3426 length:486 start_codon:yes stop_codon:yes gene_type:complete